MKNLLAAIIFLCFCSNMHAQIGFQVQYQRFQDTSYILSGSGFNEFVQADQLGFGIDYAFKLKNYRVEFFPAILYFNKKINKNSIFDTELNTNITTLGLQFNTHIYFLDIEGDCNCPTWNKDGSFMKKGLFAWVSINAYNTVFKQNTPATRNMFTYGASGGLGLDIGLSKHLTLTPFAGLELEQRPVVEFTDLKAERDTKSMYKLDAGIRLGWHWGK